MKVVHWIVLALAICWFPSRHFADSHISGAVVTVAEVEVVNAVVEVSVTVVLLSVVVVEVTVVVESVVDVVEQSYIRV